MTEFICPVCGQTLETVVYFNEGVRESKLWCSDPIARSQPNHQAVVFYLSGSGEFWSPGLRATPGAKSNPVRRPKRSRRKAKACKRRNRQRQLSL